ncbi:MAG: putative zinc-binding metallopeptidase [Gammaproteobacteria bacterium]|nr:putative zinc-binding metallopeptidase [Gammaproteobacteria bacterium]
MRNYYRNGPRPNWQREFVSAYASSHPWEDWSECWAHYLTIVDALDTAQAFGVEITLDHTGSLFSRTDSYTSETFDDMLEQWLPLTYAMNSINRSGGSADLYPFVLPGPAIDKLRFVHDIIKTQRPK